MMRILVCVLFLYRQAEVSLSDQMICSASECFHLYQEAVDFQNAQKICQSSSTELLMKRFDLEVRTLLDGKNGSYWSEALDANMTMCSRVEASDMLPHDTKCDTRVDGFICRLPLDDPCGRLRSGDGAQVRYSALNDAEVIKSEFFPQGTTAVTFNSGGKYPNSKHICAFKKWEAAPWSCEVEKGGCEHGCKETLCVCPSGQVLHPNRFSCTDDICEQCEHRCDGGVCVCERGYNLQQDGKSCMDVDECKEKSPCTRHGEECVNTQGGYECTCMEDFEEEDGECVDNSICFKCEHKCKKIDGVYGCVCDKGFTVSEKDPHKCNMQCTTRDCPATCIWNPDADEKDWQCDCPRGFILDYTNSKHICTDIDECFMDTYCDHLCENLFGGFKCLCEEGFELHGLNKCVPLKLQADDGSGSGSEPSPLEVPTAQPAAVPSYIKTGSILGLTLFSGLGMVLLLILVRQMAKRCDKLELSPVKGTEVDIDYLQQVTTDTYKMLPVE